MEGRREYLREAGALSPDTTVVADDSRGGEVLAFDLAHQVLINVGLPRHLDFLCFGLNADFFKSSSYTPLREIFWFKEEKYK